MQSLLRSTSILRSLAQVSRHPRASPAGFSQRSLWLVSHAHSQEGPNKKRKGGEDAFLAIPSHGALAVADGVGGWVLQNIDSGDYSREFIREMSKSVRAGVKDCAHILHKAHMSVMLPGSSTATLVILDSKSNDDQSHDNQQQKQQQQQLESSIASSVWRSATLGDSLFLIIRDGQVLHMSKPQHHSFNCPYAFSMADADTLRPLVAQHAGVWSIEARAGDIAIVATDGLWDNLFTNDILDITAQLSEFITKELHKGDGPNADLPHRFQSLVSATCSHLVKFATNSSASPDFESPFAISAQRSGLPHRGGKPDDMTVTTK